VTGDFAWHFRVVARGQPRAEIWGEEDKRNWVFWKLSEYALAFEDVGVVTVERRNNGKWETCNGWRELAH